MLEQVATELRAVGFAPKVVEFPSFGASRQAVLIDIDVQNGRYKGQRLTIGLSFQEDAYPEYPPHFVHLRSTVQTNITRHSTHQFEGDEWSAFSLPPSDFWDALDPARKNMKTYYTRHLLRILNQL